MKKIFFAILLGLLQVNTHAQLYNNGVPVSVNMMGSMQVKGDFTNSAGSQLNNNGELLVGGNFTNNQVMTNPGSGLLVMNGSTLQYINGTAPLLAYGFEISNAAGVELNNTLKVMYECNFSNGLLNAPATATPLIIAAGAFVSNGNPAKDASHVKGYVIKEGTGAFTFPVGDGIKYQPIAVNLSANNAGLRAKYEPFNAGAANFSTAGTEPVALQAYNTAEYWNLTALNSATGTVTVYWDNYKNVIASNPVDLRVAHKNGGSWLNEGTVGTGSVTQGSVTSNVISNWSLFTAGSKTTVALPVTGLDFFATRLNSQTVQLNWKTLQEFNNKGFYIERRKDNESSFTTIDYVATHALNGNSNTPLQYQRTDNNDYPGTSFYRLKQEDIDGNFTYSYIRTVTGTLTLQAKIHAWPVPSAGPVNVQVTGINKPARLLLFDMSGKLLQQLTLLNNESIQIKPLAAGTYIIQLAGNKAVRQTIVVQ